MTAPQTRSSPPEWPPLQAGEHLDQKTFHARYEAMPPHVKAELIGGVVHMPSPLGFEHGEPHAEVNTWLGVYKSATPGIRLADNATVILGEFSEPQPDTSLRILPEFGGECHSNPDGYLQGPPDLLVEVAVSSAHHDLNAKRRDYETLGVREYLVLLVEQTRVVWFVRRAEGFVEMTPGDGSIYRSELFGGLWLDADALFRLDTARVLEVLRHGLESADHAAFVERLRQRASGGHE